MPFHLPRFGSRDDADEQPAETKAHVRDRDGADDHPENTLSKFHGLLTAGITKINHLAADNHILLGKNPNAIPPADPSTNDPEREVRIGFHPVGGALGVAVTHALDLHPFHIPAGAPDPTYHWGIIVGEYYHELNCDGDFNVVYQNGVLHHPESDTTTTTTTSPTSPTSAKSPTSATSPTSPAANPPEVPTKEKPSPTSEWEYYHIGTTTHNDEAIRLAGEEVISHMRSVNPHYHILQNNCQLFTLNLATQICLDAIPQVYTSWRNDVWQKNAQGEVATKIAQVMNREIK